MTSRWLSWILAAVLLLATTTSAADSTISIGRNQRIVIVGGGPAGVHYASVLALKGFTNIRILEAGTEVGGKSMAYTDEQGLRHDLGTCYAHTLYQPVFDLLSRYDPGNVPLPFFPTNKGQTWVLRDGVPTTDYNSFNVQVVMVNGKLATPQAAAEALAAAITRYIQIHNSIFGVYPYGLPPKPNDWSLVRMSAWEFLVRNDLTVLAGPLSYTLGQQGYGFFQETPAFYMLWWVHPDLIKNRRQYMLSKGFQSLWTKMAKAFPNQVTVSVRHKVTNIARSTAGITISALVNDTTPVAIQADHLVMAVDLGRIDAPVPSDVDGNERLLFRTQEIVATFVVTLIESDPSPIESVSEWWPDRGVGSLQGRLQLTRNTRLALYSPNSSVANNQETIPGSPPVTFGVNATGRQRRVAYQYYLRPAQSNDASMSQSTLLQDLRLANMSNVNVLKQVLWNYAPRYSQSTIEQGTPWKVWEQQGYRNTTWIGSSVAYESVLDVVTYNNNLIKRVVLT
ncbi:unnamed protein product [Aphanomyces euteiches]|uniref:Amine oxidase domain-containing protein n=1 Tax=Aphanomyces euteiches TaxID=100861 RepID=A0A6G0WR16_9STRA|nr:hypothetical protein Ae201684_012622 [Aphanomyces euteiches]KAH9100714.1 hypothetical protein Ae201684P_006908 [Aphanomyces euteiches]KAH9152435.1 hypothetical protein AeRB84_005138 [Aphanomyces euteiches]